MEIKNVPEYAAEYRYIVFRMVDGVRWFWGAYNDRIKAENAALMIGGAVHDTV